MNKDDEEKITETNIAFQDANDKDDSQERVEFEQPQNLKETPAPVFMFESQIYRIYLLIIEV